MKIDADISWIVPHSPYLLRKFGTQINVKLSNFKVWFIKHLFTYVCKGHGWENAEAVNGDTDDTGGKTTEGVTTID